MKPTDWEGQTEIKIPPKLFEMLERLAKKEGKDTDTLIKYILLDALAPSVEEEGQRIGQRVDELGKKLIEAFSKLKKKSPDEPPGFVN